MVLTLPFSRSPADRARDAGLLGGDLPLLRLLLPLDHSGDTRVTGEWGLELSPLHTDRTVPYSLNGKVRVPYSSPWIFGSRFVREKRETGGTVRGLGTVRIRTPTPRRWEPPILTKTCLHILRKYREGDTESFWVVSREV